MDSKDSGIRIDNKKKIKKRAKNTFQLFSFQKGFKKKKKKKKKRALSLLTEYEGVCREWHKIPQYSFNTCLRDPKLRLAPHWIAIFLYP